MPRRACFSLTILGLLLAAPAARADSFTIKLLVRAGKDAIGTEVTFPPAKTQPRPVVSAGAGTPVTVKWVVRNMDTAAAKDVLVHFFVVKEDKPGQAQVPKLNRNVIAESALSMDFRPQDATEGEITFTVGNPGAYLIRLELKGTANKDEPCAALDLVVR